MSDNKTDAVQPVGGRDQIAEAVHRGRFREGDEPTPFADEDRSGREYCYRIADSVIATGPQLHPVGGVDREAVGAEMLQRIKSHRFIFASSVDQAKAAIKAGWKSPQDLKQGDEVGCAEPQVGRAVYQRIEKLMDLNPKPNTPEWSELDYLSFLTGSVEEYGSYDGPLYATAPTAGSGWLPIESAPKDGTRFWGRIGDDALSMLWHEGFGEFVTCWRRMEMAPGYTIDGETFREHSPDVQKPTAWMPLPAAQTVEDK